MCSRLAVTILLVSLFHVCWAAESAQFQIQKEYPLTALSADGTNVVHAGTILVIQTPNIYATSAVGRFGAYPNTFKGGKLSGPSFIVKKSIEMAGGPSHFRLVSRSILQRSSLKKGTWFSMCKLRTTAPEPPSRSNSARARSMAMQPRYWL